MHHIQDHHLHLVVDSDKVINVGRDKTANDFD